MTLIRSDAAAVRTGALGGSVLSSSWSGLSPHLLVMISAVDPTGMFVPGAPTVAAPVAEGASIEVTANWQSTFEQSGSGSSWPTLMAMAQSGQFESYARAVLPAANANGTDLQRLAAEIKRMSRVGLGRSGATKLNSTQVYLGSTPMKVSLTLLFRAFADPLTEVREPVDQLVAWTLPQRLAPDGGLVSAIREFKAGASAADALLPSLAPQMVRLTHGGLSLYPMVIESLSIPFSGPRESTTGELLHAKVQMSLSTISALDEGDWRRARGGEPIELFNNR